MISTTLLLLSTLSIYSAPRDDTDSGLGFGGTIIFFIILIVCIVVGLNNESKKK